MNLEVAYTLHEVLNKVKSSALSVPALQKYIRVKIALMDVVNKVEDNRTIIAEETKVEDAKAWDNKFKEVFQDFIKGKVDVDPKVLSEDDLITLIKNNELTGAEETFLMMNLLKEESEEITEVEEVKEE